MSDEQIERINDLEKTVGETKAEAVKLDKQSIVQEQRVEDFTEQVQMIEVELRVEEVAGEIQRKLPVKTK